MSQAYEAQRTGDCRLTHTQRVSGSPIAHSSVALPAPWINTLRKVRISARRVSRDPITVPIATASCPAVVSSPPEQTSPRTSLVLGLVLACRGLVRPRLGGGPETTYFRPAKQAGSECDGSHVTGE